jgi:hypothetical protein
MHRRSSAGARPGSRDGDDASEREAGENDCPFSAGVCVLPRLFDQRVIAFVLIVLPPRRCQQRGEPR